MPRPKKIEEDIISLPEDQDEFVYKINPLRTRYKDFIAELADLKVRHKQHDQAMTSIGVQIKQKEGEITALKGVIDKLIER